MATAGQNMAFQRIQRRFRHSIILHTRQGNRYSAPNVHLAAPLSALTHQAADYRPGKVHFENFNQLKLEISNMKTLPYFDVNAVQERTQNMYNPEGESHMLCLQGPHLN